MVGRFFFVLFAAYVDVSLFNQFLHMPQGSRCVDGIWQLKEKSYLILFGTEQSNLTNIEGLALSWIIKLQNGAKLTLGIGSREDVVVRATFSSPYVG